MNYDNMPVEELILHFRDKYEEVYLTVLEDEEFIWRTLTQKEYAEIREFAENEQDAYERICNTAVLHPSYNFKTTGRAYLPDMLAPSILNESGYGEVRKEQGLLKIFREQIKSSFEMQAEIIINRAFPHITFEEMENWTKEKLIKYVSRAEWSLSFIDQKHHVKLMTEEEIREQMIENGEMPEDAPEEPKFDIMEVANELRRRGEDPMFVLRGFYQKDKPDYVDRPMIGGGSQNDSMIAGTDAWKGRELPYGRYDIISEQIQKLSRG